MTTLLLAGATGLVGNQALRLSLADERVDQVVALSRRPIEPHPKLRNVVVDFANLPASADWWNVDGVISALGTTRARTPSPEAYRAIDHDYPLTLARLARAHGATRLALVSSLGTDPRSRFAYTRLKGELEEAIASLKFPSLTFVRPSVLEGERGDARVNERLALAVMKFLGPMLPIRWRPTSATAMAALLVEGSVAAPPGTHIRTNEDAGT